MLHIRRVHRIFAAISSGINRHKHSRISPKTHTHTHTRLWARANIEDDRRAAYNDDVRAKRRRRQEACASRRPGWWWRSRMYSRRAPCRGPRADDPHRLSGLEAAISDVRCLWTARTRIYLCRICVCVFCCARAHITRTTLSCGKILARTPLVLIYICNVHTRALSTFRVRQII